MWVSGSLGGLGGILEKEKKSRGDEGLFMKFLINSQSSSEFTLGLPKSKALKSLPKCCFNFQHNDYHIKEYQLNVESLSKNRLIFAESFRSRRGGLLLLSTDISYIFA